MKKSSQSALSQLLSAISDSTIQKSVEKVVEVSTAAIEQLSRLDDKIYAHYDNDGNLLQDRDKAEGHLRELANDVLKGVRRLDDHLNTRAQQARPPSSTAEDEGDMDFDFDFGTEGDAESGGESTSDKNSMDIGEFDLDGAFDMLSESYDQSCQERWQALDSELQSLSYALRSQLRDFDERFEKALKSGRYLQALRELNDVGSSLTDGVFALMTSVYESFLDEVDAEDLIPGHKNTLARALMVRRGLADLRRVVSQKNVFVQDTEQEEKVRNEAFSAILGELGLFIWGDVFRIMRPADRVEFKKFQKKFEGHTANEARFDCEGLDKYLDSLMAVSQRDVLIKHDRDESHEIAGLLEAARPLIDISPHGALAMLAEAFEKADTLYGLRDPLDGLLGEWREMSKKQRKDPTQAVLMGARLEPLVRGLL
jgi:hypothetical protein